MGGLVIYGRPDIWPDATLRKNLTGYQFNQIRDLTHRNICSNHSAKVFDVCISYKKVDSRFNHIFCDNSINMIKNTSQERFNHEDAPKLKRNPGPPVVLFFLFVLSRYRHVTKVESSWDLKLFWNVLISCQKIS